MRHLTTLLIAGSLLGVQGLVSGETIPASDPMHVTVDWARFRGADDLHALVEVYYAIAQRGLSHSVDSSTLLGNADVTLLVLKKDSVVSGQRWLVPSRVRDTAMLKENTNLVGVQDFELGPGEYTLKIISRDRAKPERADSVSIKLPIVLLSTAEPTLSDIEFAATIRQGQKGTPFYKNTLSVIPNVGSVYSEKDRCFFYAELYNLLKSEDRSEYTLKTSVYDAVGREVISKESQRKRTGESSVIVDHFPVQKLRSGAYSLQLTIEDSAHKMMAVHARRFFVYNRVLGVDSSLLAGAKGLPLVQFARMEEPDLDKEFQTARYESSDPEKAQYKQLSGTEAKRKFLSDFWRRRSPERRDQYLALVQFANQNFRYLGRDGYRTDRGRVYIMYGAPDDIERHPNESDMKPYEIWNYHQIEGGVIFVFVLKNPGGDYELVHSTARNELHDGNWDRPGITR